MRVTGGRAVRRALGRQDLPASREYLGVDRCEARLGSASVDKLPRNGRVDWHRVTFWSSLGVILAYLWIASWSPNGRIVTVFEAEGRRSLTTYARYHFPNFAAYMGWTR